MNAEISLSDFTVNSTLAEISEFDSKASELLASIGVSVSQNKEETLRSLCQRKDWREKEVLRWIKSHCVREDENSFDVKSESDEERTLEEWIIYLKEYFINPNLTLIENILNRYATLRNNERGNSNQWKEKFESFEKLADPLQLYYHFEKEMVFPLVDRFLNSRRSRIKHGTIRNIKRSLRIMDRDQERMRRIMKTIEINDQDFRNNGNADSTLLIQKESLNILFNRLSNQFRKEQDYFMPLVSESISDS